MIVSEFLTFKNLEFNGPGPENWDTAGGLPNLRIPGGFLLILDTIGLSAVSIDRMGLSEGFK